MSHSYSIVIASYRYGHLASHAIESVLSQSKPFDKIYFVDDAAGDCQHLPKLYPSVEFVLREKNMGVIDNFNDMLSKIKTDYVMFLGADNWLRSDTLELLSTNNTDIITYDIIVTGELRNELKRYYNKFIKPYNGDLYWSRKMEHHGSMVYHAKLARAVGGYASRTKGRTDEDHNLWDKLIKIGASVSHVEEGLLYYRRHKENFYKY